MLSEHDIAAHARYYAHWKPGWPVSGTVVFKDGIIRDSKLPYIFDANSMGARRDIVNPRFIDIQALTGVLVAELWDRHTAWIQGLFVYQRTSYDDMPQPVSAGHTPLDALVNAQIALHTNTKEPT